MSETVADEAGWRPIKADSNIEVNVNTGDIRGEERPFDDGLSGDREPRNPKISPNAGAAALKLAEVAKK